MGLLITSGNFFSDQGIEMLRWKNQRLIPPTGAFHRLLNIGTGLTESGTVSTFTVTSTASGGNTYTTGNVSGNSSGQLCDAIHSVAHSLRSIWQITVSSTTACRYWLGYSNGTVANMVDSDTPAFSFLGFRFSTVAGDTNWKCATDNGSGTPNIVDSGVAVAAGEYLMGIAQNSVAGSAQFFINRTGAGDPAQRAISSTKIPSTATLMAQFAGVETTAAAAKNFTVHYMNSRSRLV